MKCLLTFLLASSLSVAQASFTIQVATESPVTITMSAEAVSSGALTMLGTAGPGTSPTTLTASATNSQTTFQVANVIGVQTCMGILIGSELSLITGISGSGPFTLTVVRGSIGTTKAAYSSGQTASYAAWGSSSCYVAGLFALAAQNGMIIKPGPLVTAQQAAIVTANGTIATLQAAGVTHAP